MMDQDDFEALYGPLAQYSEHRCGDMIRYLHEGTEKRGTIIWVCAPGMIDVRQIGITYVVEPPGGGWPDMVFPGDVLASD